MNQESINACNNKKKHASIDMWILFWVGAMCAIYRIDFIDEIIV